MRNRPSPETPWTRTGINLAGVGSLVYTTSWNRSVKTKIPAKRLGEAYELPDRPRPRQIDALKRGAFPDHRCMARNRACGARSEPHHAGAQELQSSRFPIASRETLGGGAQGCPREQEPATPAKSLILRDKAELREEGLEPSRLAAPDPKSGASAVPPLSRKQKGYLNPRWF
jgi:hypothetical protein